MLKSNPSITYRQLQEGVYHSDFSFQLHSLEGRNSGYTNSPELPSGWYYGVCDSVENLLERIPELVTSEREFVVLLTEIDRDTQPEEGGWRWHKWGDYIGTQTPTCEYIYDEPIIDLVYCYHIYERIQD